MTDIAVLISGRGSNLKALAAAIGAGRLHARIALVVSNQPDAAGLAWARDVGLETAVLSHRDFARREAYDTRLASMIREAGVDLVCLAGFMRLLGPSFCDAFPWRVLNVHPSLLPAFPGVDAQRQAWEHGVKVTGATVHFVTPELDAGPVVMQGAVPVLDTDTVESLAVRILAVEHAIYPEAVQKIAAGGWSVEGRRVIFTAPQLPAPNA